MITAPKLDRDTATRRGNLLSRRIANGNGHIVAVNDNSAPPRGTGYGYDASGDLTGFTDAAGAVTTYSYTPPGGTLAPGLLTRIFPGYDSVGNVVTVTDPNGGDRRGR